MYKHMAVQQKLSEHCDNKLQGVLLHTVSGHEPSRNCEEGGRDAARRWKGYVPGTEKEGV